MNGLWTVCVCVRQPPSAVNTVPFPTPIRAKHSVMFFTLCCCGRRRFESFNNAKNRNGSQNDTNIQKGLCYVYRRRRLFACTKQIQLVLSAFKLFSVVKWKAYSIERHSQFCAQSKFEKRAPTYSSQTLKCVYDSFDSETLIEQTNRWFFPNGPTSAFYVWHFHCAGIGLCCLGARHSIAIFADTLNADFSTCVRTRLVCVRSARVCVWNELVVDSIVACWARYRIGKCLTFVSPNGQWIDNGLYLLRAQYICPLQWVCRRSQQLAKFISIAFVLSFTGFFGHYYVSNDGKTYGFISKYVINDRTRTHRTCMHWVISFIFADIYHNVWSPQRSSFQPISELMCSTCSLRIFLPP